VTRPLSKASIGRRRFHYCTRVVPCIDDPKPKHQPNPHQQLALPVAIDALDNDSHVIDNTG